MEHILQQTYCLQTNRLTTRIWSGNNHYAALSIELHIERNNCAFVAFERLCQQRVLGRAEHQTVLLRDDRLAGSVLEGPTSFSSYHICHRHKGFGALNIIYVEAHNIGEGGQYANNLSTLLILQLTKHVVQLYHLGRFDIEGLSCGRLIVNKAIELTLVCRRNRDYGTALTNRNRSVAIYNTTRLCRLQNCLQSLRYLAFVATNLGSDLAQLLRCTISHHALIVDNATDIGHDIPQSSYRLCERGESRISLRVTLVEELYKVARRDQRLAQLHNFGNLQECTLDLCLLDNLGNIVKLLGWSLSLREKYLAHLLGESVAMFYLVLVGGKSLLGKQITGMLHRTQCNTLLSNGVETNLLLEV